MLKPRSSSEGSESEYKKSSRESPLVQVKMNLNAPIDRVFEAWSDENLLKQWWAPAGLYAPFVKNDFQVGGKYLMSMKSEDKNKDTEIWSTGYYMSIVPPRKLVLKDWPANSDGEIIKSSKTEGPFADDGPTFITVEIEAQDEHSCKLTLSHAGLPKRMHDDCEEGWNSALRKLKHLVEKH